MAKEFADHLRFLANIKYNAKNEKGMKIDIGSSYWNSDGYWVNFHISVPFLKFFKRPLQVGHVVSPSDINPWFMMELGFKELEADAKLLLQEAIKYASEQLIIIKQADREMTARIKSDNEKIAKAYLKGNI